MGRSNPAVPRRRPRAGARWSALALALAALLSLAFHSLVVQAHVHPAEPPAALSVVGDGSGIRPAQHVAPPSAPFDCPTCRQFAEAGSYLLPAVDVPVLAAVVFAPFAILPLPRVAGRRRSHAWRSRGPPGEVATPLT